MNASDIEIIKTILNAQPYILWLDDYVNLRPFYVNDRGKAYYGLKKNDLSKNGFEFFKELIHPDCYTYLKNSVKIFGKDPFHTQVEPTKVKSKDGEYHWVYIACRAISFESKGNTMYILSLIFDIDELVSSTMQKSEIYHDSSFIIANKHLYESLTVRQKQIVKLIANGSKSHEIATMLNVTTETVKTHRKNILKKLQIKSMADLVKLSLHFD